MKGLPLKFAIPGMGRDIMKVAAPPSEVAPRFRQASKEKSRKDLDAVRKHSALLRKSLEAAGRPTIEALSLDRGSNYRTLVQTLQTLEWSASFAVLPDIPPNAGRGRPLDRRSLLIARRLLFFYVFLTKKTPKRTTDQDKPSGTYYFLVWEIFRILRLSGSVEHYVRQAIEAGPLK